MSDCVELSNLDVIESLGMIRVCYIACYCCWLSDSTALECMDTIGKDSKIVLETYYCKTGVFGPVSRGNRFPSGRTRFPSVLVRKTGHF